MSPGPRRHLTDTVQKVLHRLENKGERFVSYHFEKEAERVESGAVVKLTNLVKENEQA
jgi:hypothetical protein